MSEPPRLSDQEQADIDGPRIVFGFLSVLWLLVVLPIWFIRFAGFGPMNVLRLSAGRVMAGDPIEICLILLGLLPAAIPLWIAHERRHRSSRSRGHLFSIFK